MLTKTFKTLSYKKAKPPACAWSWDQDGPKLEGNEPTMLFLGRPTHIAIPLKILPAARQVFTSNLLVDS